MILFNGLDRAKWWFTSTFQKRIFCLHLILLFEQKYKIVCSEFCCSNVSKENIPLILWLGFPVITKHFKDMINSIIILYHDLHQCCECFISDIITKWTSSELSWWYETLQDVIWSFFRIWWAFTLIIVMTLLNVNEPSQFSDALLEPSSELWVNRDENEDLD